MNVKLLLAKRRAKVTVTNHGEILWKHCVALIATYVSAVCALKVSERSVAPLSNTTALSVLLSSSVSLLRHSRQATSKSGIGL
eukprot:scaffold13358_cov198-Alexandrium_tamarense.AAC.42